MVSLFSALLCCVCWGFNLFATSLLETLQVLRCALSKSNRWPVHTALCVSWKKAKGSRSTSGFPCSNPGLTGTSDYWALRLIRDGVCDLIATTTARATSIGKHLLEKDPIPSPCPAPDSQSLPPSPFLSLNLFLPSHRRLTPLPTPLPPSSS